jgi:predicted DNA binding CopG/RHH family protein
MSERTRKYSEGEIGDVKIVEDFLPSPSELVLREDNVKITLSLSRRSVEFFKREAGKARVPYQRMVRALVDTYAARSEKALASRHTGAKRSPFVLSKESQMAKASGGKSGGKGNSHRSAVTGRFGKSHPSATVRETNKPGRGGKKGK